MLFHERAQTIPQSRPNRKRVFLQALVTDNVEHGEANGARDRIAAERGEELHPVRERIGDFARGDNRRHRVAVADGLAHHHDVGHDGLPLEPPEMAPHATKANLHLVGDAEASGGADVPVRRLEVALRWDHLPAAAEQRFADESGDGFACLVNHATDRIAVGRPRIEPLAFVRPPIAIGHRDDVDPRFGLPATAFTHEFVRANGDQLRRVAVVCAVHHEEVLMARHRSCEAEGEFVGFAA